ncbi:SIR2 family protein [Lichenibacterium dinghuense]|uniref:SIR2 family protein n=1 Tax=Lichenibacterium dinghuense TaxID=2895977 RepID=UPI001F2AB4FB|nr:SIR2 family protein [Lichenibacterium sp. 6Y81]
MAPETITRLLASMNAGRLLVVCGAGLSMAPPSSLPSARAVAERCFDKYRLESDPNCDLGLRENLEALAEHFAGLNTLQSIFIEHLVPWPAFTRPSNMGHAAIADFLITHAAVAGISGNFDTLIERRAWDYGADFRGSLDGDEATADTVRQAPLLKFHGCSHRDRQATVWAPSQLNDPTISERIARSKIWMAANLRQKDLLVVGFWSDWEYLNAVIGEALSDVQPLSVTVIDLSPANVLEQKAPQLWEIAHAHNVTFEHVQESGAAALDELRRAFSSNYLRQVLDAGRAVFEQATGARCVPAWLDIGNFDSEALYGLRRDAEGVSAVEPAKLLRPENPEALGFFHLLLRRAGAVQRADGYDLNGRRIRVLNGAQSILGTLRGKFVEPPAAMQSDIVVAVGATDLGLPDNVVRSGRSGDVIRPDPIGEWYDLSGARAALSI